MGHLSTKQELIAILRRFDMDGDAKINQSEFALGMKSSLTLFAKKATTKRPKSSTQAAYYANKLVTSNSKVAMIRNQQTTAQQTLTPRGIDSSSQRRVSVSSKVRPQRPRTGKQRMRKASLVPYSGSMMPREASNGKRSRQKTQTNMHLRQYSQDRSCHSPTNLNKSVSFSQSVKVREFPSNSNRRSNKTSKVTQGMPASAMPQRRLEYDQSPSRYSSGGGASSAR